MSNFEPETNFQQRVVVAFLLVPWLPLLIAAPYNVEPNFSIFGWDRLPQHLALCAVIAGFTYVLEIVVLVPAWLWMLRNRKATLPRILTFVVLIAFTCGMIFFRLPTDPRVFTTVNPITTLLPLMCLIAGAEALLFWLIVRPDKLEYLDGS